ncbi:hypothetical protein CSC2_12500 [Clostridium zeae]|uniref:Uncharacterized protein n=1 Tax=Clostridium zeae TaxID=2759022 RepID=A0ABQ1E7I5_9CLOT|nr:hypothetical protein [Clostridium zeae]GFZ30724.1 hypothetical protein CSC2_12500 [Clostridium zeae]
MADLIYNSVSIKVIGSLQGNSSYANLVNFTFGQLNNYRYDSLTFEVLKMMFVNAVSINSVTSITANAINATVKYNNTSITGKSTITANCIVKKYVYSDILGVSNTLVNALNKFYVDVDMTGTSSILTNAITMRYSSANVISNTIIIANATLRLIRYSTAAITAKTAIGFIGWKKTLIYRNASFVGRYSIVAGSQNIKPSKQTLLFNLPLKKIMENIINFNKFTNLNTSFGFDANLDWDNYSTLNGMNFGQLNAKKYIDLATIDITLERGVIV